MYQCTFLCKDHFIQLQEQAQLFCVKRLNLYTIIFIACESWLPTHFLVPSDQYSPAFDSLPHLGHPWARCWYSLWQKRKMITVRHTAHHVDLLRFAIRKRSTPNLWFSFLVACNQLHQPIATEELSWCLHGHIFQGPTRRTACRKN